MDVRRPIGYRPPGCRYAGEPSSLGAEVTSSGGLRAECPGCGQTLWLNRVAAADPLWPVRYTFPEHIDRPAETRDDLERQRKQNTTVNHHANGGNAPFPDPSRW